MVVLQCLMHVVSAMVEIHVKSTDVLKVPLLIVLVMVDVLQHIT